MKNVLLTGSTGFLGQAIKEKLNKIYSITAISREQFDFKTSKDISLLSIPDIIIHCAGFAHFVPSNEIESKLFFEINYEGTKRFLKALEEKEYIPQSFVYISSVSVYGLTKGNMITETQELRATDPYGKSKILTEELILNWCSKRNIICSILRLPLIVGAKPKGNLQKMIKAIKSGFFFNIGNGKAKKSMVYISDICNVIPKVSQIGGIYNLTDRYHPSFEELSKKITLLAGKNNVFNIPLPLAIILAKLGNLFGQKSPFNTSTLEKMSNDLTFDDTKAVNKLNWKPTLILDIINEIL